jgi:UDP-N-acetylmuramoyl-L-alanyl-D-glutamate--2,6-diaminopimelate ligase
MPLLTELMAGCSDEVLLHGEDVAVSDLTADSRAVKDGMLFAAIPGVNRDGAAFIPQVVEQGAVALLAQHPHEALPTITSNNLRRSLAQMAGVCYPHQPSHIMVVTGTNGKTSVADFYRQLWQLRGQKAVSIGTLGLRGASAEMEERFPAVNTSPDPVLLVQMLQGAQQEGADYAAIEASSHGLHQYRMEGVKITSAVFTNFTQDHLDYHGDMESYFLAKARLFTELNPQHCIINYDDVNGQRLSLSLHGKPLMTYGRFGDACRLLRMQPVAQGIEVQMALMGEIFDEVIPLYGEFQVYNIAAACCAVVADGMSPKEALSLIRKLEGVSGRMEKVGEHPSGAPMFIDYAHTPDALEQVLKSLRAHCRGKLHVVFGCGGDRDKTKRPLMGGVAEKLADNIIITDDNPRSEDAAGIRLDVMSGIKEKQVTQISGRREAINVAVQHLAAEDILVVAGKGHEAYQIIGDQKEDFNDKAELLEAVRTL